MPRPRSRRRRWPSGTTGGGGSRRAKQTTPQAGGGSGPGGSVIIDVTALLELAAWCRPRREELTGGTACPTPPAAPRPPAPDADTGSDERRAAGVGPPAGRPTAATPRTPRSAPRPTPRGQRPQGGRP